MIRFIVFLGILRATAAFGQGDIRITVLDHDSRSALGNATVSISGAGTLKANQTDSSGKLVFTGLIPGQYELEVSHVGYTSQKVKVAIRDSVSVSHEFLMEQDEEEEDEVIIESTRSNRSIRDIPTRIEFIAGEELDEKSNMKPGDIRMVLNESTGIQTQQTSVTSGNAAIRIQGLDGRYTQVLKDGMPAFAGMSSGLGLLQTPPLDLKQFEVIKGSASTLYGGGAIAGLVNLISRTPGEQRELKFHVDVTSAGGLNTSGFYGQKFNKAGVTLFLSRNSNAPYDPASIGLTAIPKYVRYTVNPKLFIYFSPETQMTVGVNFSTEDRTGGDIEFIKGNKNSGFFENNQSNRVHAQFKLEHRLGNHDHINFKASYSIFKRDMSEPGYRFWGKQHSGFTELTYSSHGEKLEWIGGLNLNTDEFEELTANLYPRDYRQLSFGAFIQNNWKLNEKIFLESGLRGEQVRNHRFVLLPRASALFKFNPKLTSRLGGGLGYKTPNVFTEESERLQYKNVLPIDENVNILERSYGLNADINYRTKLGEELDLTLNHLFFYTRIQDPLVLQAEGSYYRFNNLEGHFDSRGMETNMKLGFKDFKLFLGYTFTRAYLHEAALEKQNFLTPRHRLNTVLLYEVEEKLKMGLEAYYFGRQLLSDGAYGQSYWVTGFMAEKLWEKISVYINFENFLDTRQTRMGTIFTGPLSSPVFKDIYAPLDGFVINGGVKLRL